ncbi:hypothetical protein MASR2M39_08160 [Ignavibacteriales bacterium]
MRLFVYASLVAAFILGLSWTGHTTLASNNGDPKKELKKQECPYLGGEKTATCPYTGMKGECPYSGDKSECPVTGEKGKTSSDKVSMPVKKIEVKKV